MQVKDTSGKPKDPSITEILKAAVLSWYQCHLTGKGKQQAWANKISAIKHKGQQNPSFQQQQKQLQGEQLQQSTDTGGEKKKSCHGKKGKGKLQDHAHIASTVFFPTMITDMLAAVDPCLYTHQSPQLYQGQGGPAFDLRIKGAFSLTDWLGVTPFCKTICTLDACISPLVRPLYYWWMMAVIVQVPPGLTPELWSCCRKVEHWVQLMCCLLARLLL